MVDQFVVGLNLVVVGGKLIVSWMRWFRLWKVVDGDLVVVVVLLLLLMLVRRV